jgi:hypothetical protein
MRLDRPVEVRSSATGIGWVVVGTVGLAACVLLLAAMIAWLV